MARSKADSSRDPFLDGKLKLKSEIETETKMKMNEVELPVIA